MPYKIGILTTHPIQYQVPWFRALARHLDIDLSVFYCMLPDAKQQGDGFGVEFHWDIPLLEGYRYEVLQNVSRKPSVTAFWGCDTPGIEAIVRDRGFDAFVVNGWVAKSCLQLLFACRRHGVPCIVRGESNALRPRPWWKRLLHRLLLRNYSAFLYIGKSNREFYLRNGVPEEKLFPGLYCVDNDWFAAEVARLRPQRDRLREKWGIRQRSGSVTNEKELPAEHAEGEARKNVSAGRIPSGEGAQEPAVFLFCGKLVAKKHPDRLLRAAEIARGHCPCPPFHILIVGDGELRQECERRAKEKKLPVTFAGFLNQGEIAQAYVASDCLVLPSDYGETWGLVVNEAMACGLPAIVSDRVGCHPDLIVPGETGEIFSQGDCAALAAAMVRLTERPAALADMGAQAQRKIREHSFENLVSGTLRAIAYVSPRAARCNAP